VTDKCAPDVNALCRRCLRTCRQTAVITLVECPRFLRRPFKIAEHRFDQLDLFGMPAKAQTTDNLLNAKAQRGRKRRNENPSDHS
jgi:hypothetical protein